jgi:hypothetical protein
MTRRDELALGGGFRLVTFESTTVLEGPGLREGDGYEVERIGWNERVIVVGLRGWGWRVIDVDSGTRTGALSEKEVAERLATDEALRGVQVMPVDVARRALRRR